MVAGAANPGTAGTADGAELYARGDVLCPGQRIETAHRTERYRAHTDDSVEPHVAGESEGAGEWRACVCDESGIGDYDGLRRWRHQLLGDETADEGAPPREADAHDAPIVGEAASRAQRQALAVGPEERPVLLPVPGAA